jgi:hypothetical protein
VGPANRRNEKAGAPADLFSYINQSRMQKIAVLLTLALSFIAPSAIPVAQAAGAGIHAGSNSNQCRRHGSKKDGEDKPKKKKGKEEKKSYGFEL